MISNLSLTLWRLSTLTVGTFYLIAAAQRNLALLATTVPLGFLAAFVFTSTGGPWRKVAIFEGVMATITALGLLYDFQLRL
jgi:hypothetical protein